MSKIYIDCSNGISGDMLLKALKGVGAKVDVEKQVSTAYDKVMNEKHHEHTEHDHSHEDHHHHHSHQASHRDIKNIIDETELEWQVKYTTKAIYQAIATAEAKVHESTVEDVHFHEVGRKEALCNMAGIAQAIYKLDIEEIYCSPLHDGTGTIECSHGTIPVPVPAVKAMMDECNYDFVTEEDASEMVTPSGLGALIGIGAKGIKEDDEAIFEEFQEAVQKGNFRKGIGKGTRDTGRPGLAVLLIAA